MSTDKRRFKGSERQLKILLDALESRDITRWNSFVKASGPRFRAGLSGADLSGRDLGEANLARADLLGADLSNARMVQSSFTQRFRRRTPMTLSSMPPQSYRTTPLRG